MPSVGMRHSTKAFLPKPVGKDGELGTSTTALLRSGKGDEIACYKSNGWRKVIPDQMDVCALEERKFKNVYDRKRRRSPQPKEDPLYGISYTRKRFKKIGRDGNSAGTSVSDFLGRLGIESYPVLAPGETLDFTIRPSLGSQFPQMLVSILEFMRSSNVTLQELAAHMFRKSIVKALSRRGVYCKLVSGSCHDEGLLSTESFSCLVFFFSSSNLFLGAQSFSPGPSFPYYINLSGLCRIFGEQTSVPLFWLNFPAAPLSFINLHATLILRSLYQPHDLIVFWGGMYHSVDLLMAGKNVSPFLPAGIYCNDDGTHSINSSVEENSSDFGVPGFKLDWRSASTRHAVYRNIQKKRSSLRSKRSNGSLSMGLHGLQHFNANNKLKIKNPGKKNRPSLGFEMIRTIGSRRPPLATLKSNVKQTTLLKKNVLQNDKEMKSASVGSGQNMDSTYCTANALVIESDRGYREEGVTIMLECSTSKVWHLVVKAHGSIKYMHQALDLMKPCSTNRFTHAFIWTSDIGWKLEFCDRKDWLVFKELYKECISRNIEVNSSKTIPVPGVREVLNYDDGERVQFSRPDSYITAPSNEVARALAKKTTIYEIGQDDEEWLEKMNSGLANGDSDVAEYLTAEKFEDIIDIFEKTAYCSPGDISDESKFTSLCSDMGRDDIVVAVYKYWLKKRKQNRSALLRVFECQPPRRTPVEQENVCRKKRSSKRHPSQNGRDRQRSLLQGMSADQNELHVKRAEEDLSKEAKEAQEAVSNAERSAVTAIAKRKKAQVLMAVSDRATYFASMALQIAERAQLAESSSKAPDDLLPKPSE